MHSLPISKKIRLSAPAKRDLQLIGEYTLREWGSVQKRKYLGHIKNSFKLISENPAIGRSREDIDKGLISYAVQKHIVFYRITTQNTFVIRISHQSMDLEWHLN